MTWLLLASIAAAWPLQWLDHGHRRVRGAWPLWVACAALVMLNQLVLSVHTAAYGLPPWVGRFPSGWFALWDGPAVQALAAWLRTQPGLSEWTALSMLRVNAALELPFALTAWFAAGAIVGARAPRPLAVAVACVTWTGVFCVIEIQLWNPFTPHDLVLRGISALVCALAYPALLREGPAPGGLGLRGLVLACLALALHAALVVCFATLALVYLPAWSSWLWMLMLPAALALALCLAMLPSLRVHAVDAPNVAARAFTALLFAGAIPLRYAWPDPVAQGVLALMAGAALLLAAKVGGWWRTPLTLAPAVAIAATDLFGLLRGPWLAWPDLLMLQRAGLFVAAWVLVWSLAWRGPTRSVAAG